MAITRRMAFVLSFTTVYLLTWAQPARGAAPPGRYIVSTDTVVDAQTRLVWQRPVGNGGGYYNWSQAESYCQTLSLGGFSSGWRLPTRKELQSIVDYTTTHPAIDSNAFPGLTAGYFWSSSPYVYFAGYYWVIDFDSGGNFGAAGYTVGGGLNNNQVRCVR